jgi:outer membrane lipoprotein-sorting protein
MASIMKTTILTIIASIFLSSCGQQTRQNEQQITNSEKKQTELVLTEKNTDQEAEKKVGQDLFKSILDTISVKTISTDFLINNQWIYRPFDNCESYLNFQAKGKGNSYNCEMEEEYEMTYIIEGNKVFIAEYDTPHVDNEARKKIKFRDDTYIYNGHSLIMVDSKMYDIGGREWIPKIEVVINYDRKK